MSARSLSHDDCLKLALRLANELRELRRHAKRLAIGDIKRFELSIKAGEIGKEIQSLAEKFRGDER